MCNNKKETRSPFNCEICSFLYLKKSTSIIIKSSGYYILSFLFDAFRDINAKHPILIFNTEYYKFSIQNFKGLNLEIEIVNRIK